MKKISNQSYKAPKLSGYGYIEYILWVDYSGNLYLQIIGNDDSGTFSKYLLSVSKYQSERNSTEALGSLDAYNIEEKSFERIYDNNNGGFVKAALIHLLPDEEVR